MAPTGLAVREQRHQPLAVEERHEGRLAGRGNAECQQRAAVVERAEEHERPRVRADTFSRRSTGVLARAHHLRERVAIPRIDAAIPDVAAPARAGHRRRTDPFWTNRLTRIALTSAAAYFETGVSLPSRMVDFTFPHSSDTSIHAVGVPVGPTRTHATTMSGGAGKGGRAPAHAASRRGESCRRRRGASSCANPFRRRHKVLKRVNEESREPTAAGAASFRVRDV